MVYQHRDDTGETKQDSEITHVLRLDLYLFACRSTYVNLLTVVVSQATTTFLSDPLNKAVDMNG